MSMNYGKAVAASKKQTASALAGGTWVGDNARHKLIFTPSDGSGPIEIDVPAVKGEKGDPGDNGFSPVVGANGNWFVGDTDTGVKAEGAKGETGNDGLSPHIGLNGNWYVGDTDTGVRAKGDKGDTGVGVISNVKTSTAGLIDTYTMTFSDGSTFTYEVTNASAITKVSQLENDEAFIKSTVDNLVNYYVKTDVYTKDEVAELLQNLGAGLALAVCETLPTENISPTTIYLVKIAENTSSTEYVYINDVWVLAADSGEDTSSWPVIEVQSLPVTGILNNTVYKVVVTTVIYAQYVRISGAWANIGSTGTNLSEYYTKGQVDTKLAQYILIDALTTALSEYTKTADLGAAATSNSYNDLDDLPDIPDITGLETAAHAELTYAEKATTLEGYGITDAYTKDEINAHIAAAYRPGGSKLFANLPAADEDHKGYVYNILDEFTTTADFIEGAGKTFPAGTDVAIVLDGQDYKYNVMSGFVDLTNFAQKATTLEGYGITDAVASGDFIQLLADNTDDELSATSENPVQNKVVKAAIEGVSVNPLQLGEPQNVTVPFTPTSDGILSVIVSNPSESGTATAYIAVNETQAFTVQGFGGAIGTGDFAIKQGQRITLKQSIGGYEVTYKFTPFLPTTGEPVMQTYDPTSQQAKSR